MIPAKRICGITLPLVSTSDCFDFVTLARVVLLRKGSRARYATRRG